MFKNKQLWRLGGEQCYKHFPSCPQPKKSNIAFLKLVFCLYGVNKTLQPELNHSEEMMASNEQRISSVILTGSAQADVPGQWPDRAKSTCMLQPGSSSESLRLYIPFLYFINTICFFLFPFARKNHAAFHLPLCHLLLYLGLCENSSSTKQWCLAPRTLLVRERGHLFDCRSCFFGYSRAAWF